MEIFLSRHGNTFGPGDPVVWTGATNDLPLVEKGIAQADRFAEALITHEVKPTAVYCSPLQRTFKYASILIEKLRLPFQPIVDPRINEIDYGEWTGLTQEQVAARFGEDALKGWDDHSLWPATGSWGGSESKVIAEVQSFVSDLTQRYKKNDIIIVVTSNGRLRYFLTLVEGEFERHLKAGTFKVKTGNVCKLNFHNGKITIPTWNREPQAEELYEKRL